MDLIDRQAAIDAIQKEINKGIPPFDDVMGSIRCGVRLARNIIEDLPSAQPERKSGKWIPVTNGRGGHECSLCHTYAPSYQSGNEWLTDYCPNCGTKMEEAKQ